MKKVLLAILLVLAAFSVYAQVQPETRADRTVPFTVTVTNSADKVITLPGNYRSWWVLVINDGASTVYLVLNDAQTYVDTDSTGDGLTDFPLQTGEATPPLPVSVRTIRMRLAAGAASSAVRVIVGLTR